MTLAKPILAASALAFAALGFGTATPAQAGIVVKSSGPSAAQFPVGRKLDDSATITLRKGDSVTVLSGSGTQVIRGPGKHTVGARDVSNRSAFAVLTRQRSGARVRTGAVRSGVAMTAAQNPNLWNVDVTQSGKVCLADSSMVSFWRPSFAEAATYVLGSPSNGVKVGLTFNQGMAQASLPGEELPVSEGWAYSIGQLNGSPPTNVEFVMLDPVPETAEELAAALAKNGCTAQLDLLAETLMVPES